MATAKTPKKPTRSGDARVRSNDLGADESRASRSATADVERTDLDGTALSREQRLQMLRDEFKQEALPSVPAQPGWHYCWLTSNSSWDPLSKRERMGYEPVKPDEVRGFSVERMTTAGDGLVRCNEMILYKIPLEIYEMIMREFHHDQPQREEEALKARLKQGNADSSGRDLDEVEGFEDLGVSRQAPAHFA